MLGRFFDKFMFYFLVFLLFTLGFSLARNYQRVRRVEKQIEAKEAQVEIVKKETERLQNELKIVEDKDFTEKQLRDKLGLAKEGEIVVVLPPEDELRKVFPIYEKEENILPDPNWKKWLKLFI